MLNLDLPPPNGNWGTSWWRAWNLRVFQRYLERMVDAGFSNLFPLPAGVELTETKFANYLGFSYGGRVQWRAQTNWTYLNNTSLHPNDKTGILQWRGTYGDDPSSLWPAFYKWMNTPPKDDPRDEIYWGFGDATSSVVPFTAALVTGQPGGWSFVVVRGFVGFVMNNAYGGDWVQIYPPTGVASVKALIIGISKQAHDPEWAYDALMTAFARNERYQTNAPAPERNGRGGVTGWSSVAYTPMYKISGKTFYNSLLEHGMFAGAPVAQGTSYGEIEGSNPVQLAFNEILYKNLSVKRALERSCVIINDLTRPPCSHYEMEPYLEEDPTTNTATVVYRWAANVTACRHDIPSAQTLLPSLKNVISTPYVSVRSGIGKSMTGIAGAGMVVNVVLLVLFVGKRDSPVVKAASKSFSGLILLGGIIALSSVLMRTASDDHLAPPPQHPNSFKPLPSRTDWFFAIGYALVLGSLFVKTYRIDRIFRNKEIGFKIADAQLFGLLGGIVAVEVVLLLMLQFWLGDPNQTTDVVIDMSTGWTVKQVSCPKVHIVPSVLLYVWNAGLILVAAIFSFRTRKVSSAYNENIFTVAAIGVISIVSIVIVPVLQIISSPVASYLLISLGTVLGAVIPICIFAIPKLLVAYDIMSYDDNLKVMSVLPNALSTVGATGKRTDDSYKSDRTGGSMNTSGTIFGKGPSSVVGLVGAGSAISRGRGTIQKSHVVGEDSFNMAMGVKEDGDTFKDELEESYLKMRRRSGDA
ncbi:Gamma-aminobutyric acid type B receptor subunit 2 [Rhizophlyctis rosea]|nr:Gamma-aminobutyric acid type B receptor subunit 2 [Rhizophlyctis rosea]